MGESEEGLCSINKSAGISRQGSESVRVRDIEPHGWMRFGGGAHD